MVCTVICMAAEAMIIEVVIIANAKIEGIVTGYFKSVDDRLAANSYVKDKK